MSLFAEVRPRAESTDAWAEHFRIQDRHWKTRWYQQLFKFNRKLGDPRWLAIRRSIPRGGAILDAGCGLGQWVNFLRAEGYDATGMDNSKGLIEALQAEFKGEHWLFGEVQSIPLPDCSVDGVISWGVIEHDEAGPGAALGEFWRVLRPGGHAVVTVPRDGPLMRRQARSTRGEAEAFYQYFFDEGALRRAGTEAGFEVALIRPTERHFSLVFPAFYHWVRSRGTLVEAIFALLLRPVLGLIPESASMLMAVLRKPTGGDLARP